MNPCSRPGCPNTTKTKYCSRSCSAIVNNSKSPKRSKVSSSTCRVCGQPAYRSVFCNKTCKDQEKLDKDKVCRTCGDELTPENKASQKRICKPCYNTYMNEYHKAQYHRQRNEMLDMLGPVCTNCGTTEELQFDHIDYLIKELDLGKKWAHARTEVLKELEKCQVLCKECHTDKTKDDFKSMGKLVEHGGGVSGKGKCSCDLCRSKKNEYLREYKRMRHIETGNPYLYT